MTGVIVSHWRVFTDTKRTETAKRLIARLQHESDRKFLDTTAESYHKGGHVVMFKLVHDFETWPEGVYDLLVCAQHMGHGWSIGGWVEEEIDLWSSCFSIPGIKAATCFCPRPGTSNYK